jgi:hypothetical protein
MHQLTLEWTVENQNVTHTLFPNQRTKVPGMIRIGRDASRCDVVLTHPDPSVEKTVSGLHVEVFFKPDANAFYLRNCTADRQPPRQPNPAIVDGQKVITEEVPLWTGSQIRLGKMTLRVKAVGDPQVAKAPEARYVLRCSNVKEPHFWGMDYQKLTCEICGRTILGATLIYINE